MSLMMIITFHYPYCQMNSKPNKNDKTMENDKKKHFKLSKLVAAKVFAAILNGADDGDGVNMDAGLDGTASALAALFQQYVEQADDTITEVELAEYFCHRLRALQKAHAESQREGGGE